MMNITNNYAYVNAIKNLIKPGMRIKLISMHDPSPVPAGTIGTVDFIDGAGQIQMTWDNGRTLALIYGVDIFQIIPNTCGTKYVIKANYKNKNVYYKKNTNVWEPANIPNFVSLIEIATLFNSIEEAEKICKLYTDLNLKIYPVCPRCNQEYSNRSAISRTDNKTKICEKCGLIEALWDFIEEEKKNIIGG